MNVKLAVQLLSATSGKAIRYFGEKRLLKDKNWETTSDFFLLTDEFFDIFNARNLYDRKASRNAYGTSLEKQNMVLDKMIKIVGSLQVCGSNKMYPFQKGILISCTALPKLYNMLNEKYGISFLLTTRHSQVGLEHFFSTLRKSGGFCDHPDPVSVKYRLRAHILSKGDAFNTELRSISGKSLSQDKFKGMNTIESEMSEQENYCELQRELTLSAMMFSSLYPENSERETNNENDDITKLEKGLEETIEEEGDLYFAGFVAHKFPEYKFGHKVRRGEGKENLFSKNIRDNSRLTQPMPEFLKKLELLGRHFKCHHGENTLKPGKEAVGQLAKDMCKFVDLPVEVITYYVRCRTFFRIRKLNRGILASNQNYKKIHHLRY